MHGVCLLGKGIRDGGNALSGESRHLKRRETCKERGNRPERPFRYAGVAHIIRSADSKMVETAALTDKEECGPKTTVLDLGD
jgi:hypothetical protein